MLENLFKGLFDTDLTMVISVTDFLLCLGCSLVLGLVMAFAYMYRTRYTKSFVITLALLPAVVCVVIMLVNGNVGTGVAVANAIAAVKEAADEVVESNDEDGVALWIERNCCKKGEK